MNDKEMANAIQNKKQIAYKKGYRDGKKMTKEIFEKVEVIEEGTFKGWLKIADGTAYNPKHKEIYMKTHEISE